MPAQGPALVDGVDLKDAIPFIERLGECAVRGYRMRKPRPAPDERERALEMGILVASRWPWMFLESLDRIVEEARAAGAARGVIESYGWVYQGWIAAAPPGGVADRLHPVLRGHAVAHGIIPAEDSASPEGMNSTAAARALEMGYARARHMLVSEGLLASGNHQGFENKISIGRVAELQASLQNTINIVGVGRRLGTAKSQTRAVLALGLLTPVNNSGQRRYRQQDVDSFLRRLERGVPTRHDCPRGLLPVPNACRAKGVGIAKALKAIVEGRLAARARLNTGCGLRRLLVRSGDLDALRTRTRATSVETAARRLGIHPEAARNLVRLGALGKRVRPGENIIFESNIVDFERRYIPAARIARATRMSVRTVIARLRDHGIDPAFSPPSCRQIIFESVSVLKIFPRLARTG